jgi:chromosome segregation ATPase
MANNNNDAVLLLIETISNGQNQAKSEILSAVRGINDRLDTLNGRTRRNETDIAGIHSKHSEQEKAYEEFRETLSRMMDTQGRLEAGLSEIKSSGTSEGDVSMSMSKTMFTALVSGITAIWVILGPVIRDLLGISSK